MKIRKLTQLKELKLKGYYYYFKVPKPWIEKYLKFKEGDVVDITIEQPKKVKLPTVIIKKFKKSFIKLNKFSDYKLNSLFYYLRIEKLIRNDINPKKTDKTLLKFEKKIKNERGKKFLEDYRLFKKIIYDYEKIKKLAGEIPNKELKEEYEIGKEILKHYGSKV